MRRHENYWPLIRTAFLLTFAIVVTFQIYQLLEPSRLKVDAAADTLEAKEQGSELYSANCASCHGEDGEGVIAPSLNSKSFLAEVDDKQLFSLTRTGVPGTGMPAWSQDFGGPLTDEQLRQLVVFIRSWEPGLEDVVPQIATADPARGATIFASICAFCHGVSGVGTERAPALNDAELLQNFNDEWFRETIIQGRPSRGMPTWGTVLSPAQIDDVVALIGAWRDGEQFETQIDLDGEEIYHSSCAVCHGDGGEGGIGPPLKGSEFVAGESDQELITIILDGRPGTAMPGFSSQLTDREASAVVNLLRTWQE